MGRPWHWRGQMLASTLLWGTVIGIIHFVAVGALYGNPFVDRMYQAAMASDPAVRRWPSRGRYLVTQLLGTQIEVYVVTLVFLWMRPLVAPPGLLGALLFGLALAGVRVYPRFWNMWIQSTYPRRLLAVEVVNGTIGTLLVALGLELLPTA